MCGAGSPAGAGNEKRPCASLLVFATSCMPCESERRVTSSPAEGLPVVALVTVPVMFCAAANEVSKSTHANMAAGALNVHRKSSLPSLELIDWRHEPRKGQKILAQRFSAG